MALFRTLCMWGLGIFIGYILTQITMSYFGLKERPVISEGTMTEEKIIVNHQPPLPDGLDAIVLQHSEAEIQPSELVELKY